MIQSRMLSKIFEIKDLGEASFVLGIKIHTNWPRGSLGLSQKTYNNVFLEG